MLIASSPSWTPCVEKTAVMGNHTGASIAVELAAGHPDRVTAVITVGIPYWDPPEREANRAIYEVPFEIKEDGSHLMQAWSKVRRRGSSAPPSRWSNAAPLTC